MSNSWKVKHLKSGRLSWLPALQTDQGGLDLFADQGLFPIIN